jgi:hypothetical protein
LTFSPYAVDRRIQLLRRARTCVTHPTLVDRQRSVHNTSCMRVSQIDLQPAKQRYLAKWLNAIFWIRVGYR